MKIALVHYHLRRGGVARVMQHAVNTLIARGEECCILAGGKPDDPDAYACPVVHLESLAYDDPAPLVGAWDLARVLRDEAAAALKGPPDLWHIHNHSLGKNASLPGAVRILARTIPVLLQIHDFPEDGRPANYRHLHDWAVHEDEPFDTLLYPAAPQVHYAVLNQRDRRILLAAGFPPERVHYLPNAVAPFYKPSGGGAAPGGRLFLYPTRAIRRKNLGEFLLWAAVAEKGDRFAVTLAPQNPTGRPVYDGWVTFASNYQLPVAFEVGLRQGAPYERWIQHAHALATTSVAEGFGLAFLECWLARRPLVGRDLPEITADFQDAGIRLEELYQALLVPPDWVDAAQWRSAVDVELRSTRQAYGRTTTSQDVDAATNSQYHQGALDFGALDESMQKDIIARVCSDAGMAADIVPPKLDGALASSAVIEQRREAVLRTFGIDAYAGRLQAVYRDVASQNLEPLQAYSADALLDQFISPDRFHLLRT